MVSQKLFDNAHVFFCAIYYNVHCPSYSFMLRGVGIVKSWSLFMRELQRNLMALEYLLLKWMPPYTQIWPLNTMYMAFQRYFSMYVYVPSELKAPHNTIEATTTFLKDCLENLCFCIIRACKTFGKKCCSHAKFFVKFVCVGCMDNFCFFAASVVMCESHIIASGNRSIDTCPIKDAGQTLQCDRQLSHTA